MAAEQRYTIANPVGVDAICQALQSDFAAALPWLNVAYGRAFRNTKGTDTGLYYYPAVYADMTTGRYLELTPDVNQDGNTVFFYTSQPDTYNTAGNWSQLSVEVNAVFFADLRDVRPAAAHRPLEEMKQDILAQLLANNSTVYNIDQEEGISFFENFEQVYENYSYRELQKAIVNLAQYAVLRVQFTAKLNNC